MKHVEVGHNIENIYYTKILEEEVSNMKRQEEEVNKKVVKSYVTEDQELYQE